ncbi:MAG: hypothetical protein DIZ80_06080 [endosymbiont of Galathealinum brachiosum]|uniref:HTH cro/C1-type domain-containing protein n=1 Tax=endosymbiont of Galathealinum brachiosum TaxID=2200906 RepID=A0A370DHR6_9GAMM|nr:MAG: hypothetical protein DIZ80_06080 [endosymbiont of Galathealinum brachiosum]
MTDKNTASDNVENEVNDLLQKKDFGSELRKAREKSGMSISDVADSLLISVDIIKAIENSQAEALPPLTFTQGYIRSYARMLNVSADEIISDYAQVAPDSKQSLTPNSVLPVQKSSNDALMKIISFSFVICGLIVLVFWLSKADFNNIDTNIKDSLPVFNSPEKDVEQEQIIDINLKEDQVSEVIEVPDENVEAGEVSKEVAVETSVIQEQVDSESLAVDIQKEQSQSEQHTITESITDELVLSALGESWCEIEDSTGKRMFYQLLNRGQEIRLSGVAPFTVFLGNAPKVRVEINNKIVDFESLINKTSNIASIEISKNAAVISLSNR